MVVPNAGFDVDSGEWKTGSSTFLAPVKVLASLGEGFGVCLRPINDGYRDSVASAARPD